jgi:coenzyme F420-dependent glucose-6-phosphate dehydrogenase
MGIMVILQLNLTNPNRIQVVALKLRLGIILSSEEYPPGDLVRFGVLAEKVNLDSVWGSDHFHPWFHTGGHSVFIWHVLSAVGTLTQRVIIGTAVTCPLFRYPPAVVAQSFATLSCLFPGRVFLGVGTGEALNEIPCGFDWPSTHRERLERLREALLIIRLLWTKNYVTYNGKYYRVIKANLYDKPPVQIPIHVASTGVKGAELAGILGDAFMSLPTDDISLFTSKLFPALERSAKKIGRDPSEIEKSLTIQAGFSYGDYEVALRSLFQWRSTLLPVFFDLGVYDPRYIEMHGDRVSREAIEKYFLVADSEESVIKFYERYIRVGFTHLSAAVSGDVEGFIKLLGEKVAPYLRETYGDKTPIVEPYRSSIAEVMLDRLLDEGSINV